MGERPHVSQKTRDMGHPAFIQPDEDKQVIQLATCEDL